MKMTYINGSSVIRLGAKYAVDNLKKKRTNSMKYKDKYSHSRAD